MPVPGLDGRSLEGAIAATVCYFDVFAFAPRASEIHRFLIGARASRAETERALASSSPLARAVGERHGFYFLRGKDHLVPRRIRFLDHSKTLWAAARAIARRLERSGLATAGLVTGSLAAENSDEHADIDFLLTYPAGRTWTSWALVRLLGKMPGAGFSRLCPNYALPEDRLEIQPQSLFTAHELAKAVPLFGFDVYARLIRANAWAARILPNAFPLLDRAAAPAPLPALRPDPLPMRALARTAPFRALEAFEHRRKTQRDERDMGVDMREREKRGWVDRHAPTRSYQALAELRYRLDLLGLDTHPIHAELDTWLDPLGGEMLQWGARPLIVEAERRAAR